MSHPEEFREYMKAVSRTSSGNAEPHLSEAQTIAYCRGEMSAADREAAQAHLIGCEECISLYRSAGDFLQPESETEEKITAAETREDWQALWTRVGNDEPATVAGAAEIKPEPLRFPKSSRRLLVGPRLSLAMAAGLVIAFLGLGWQTWRLWREQQSRSQADEIAARSESNRQALERRLSQLEQSDREQLKGEREQRLAAEAERDQLLAQLETRQPDLPIPVFTARLSSDRGTEDDVRLHFAGATKAAKVRLMISKPYEFPEYEIELLAGGGKLAKAISGLRPGKNDGALMFRVSRSTLSAGKYRLKLYGHQANVRKLLGDYGLSVSVDR